jgi:hypothetical protein
MTTIIVNPRYIRSLRHLMAKNDIRYYLCGVHILADEKRGKFYTATNGHLLGVYHEAWADGETPFSAELIVPGDVVKALKPAKDLLANLIQRADGRWAFDGLSADFTPVDGKFPDWQRIIPRQVSGEQAHYNYDYLADFNACGREGWGCKYSVEVYQNGLSTALVKNGCPDFVGAIMPMRVAGDATLPEWLN